MKNWQNQTNKPRVSVIIVNWNHGEFLADCLDALLAQDYAPFDVTIVDNGSQDGSPAWVLDHYPDIRLSTHAYNRGFSWAFNWGVKNSVGDYVLSLNPDVVTSPGFLSEMVSVMQHADRVGAVAPKLLSAEDPALLDSTGLFVDRRRRPYDRGQGEADRDQYDSSQGAASQGTPQVFGACGAAALYRRTMLEEVALDGEYYDQDFFAYYEDADLAWRAQSCGWQCHYAPRAVATHVRGWGDALRLKGHAPKESTGPRLALRNRYLMTVKNDRLIDFLVDLPRILAAEVPRLGYAAVTRPAVLLGLWDLIRALPSALRKRRLIQERRTVDPESVRRWFTAPATAGVRPGPQP